MARLLPTLDSHARAARLWAARLADRDGPEALDVHERDQRSLLEDARQETKESEERVRWLEVADWLIAEHWGHGPEVTFATGFNRSEELQSRPDWEVLAVREFYVATTDEERQFLAGDLDYSLPHDLDGFEVVTVAIPLGQEAEFAYPVRRALLSHLAEYPDWPVDETDLNSELWPVHRVSEVLADLRAGESKRRAACEQEASLRGARLDAIEWRRAEPMEEVAAGMSAEQGHLVLNICGAVDAMEEEGVLITSRSAVIERMGRRRQTVRELGGDLWVRVVPDASGHVPLRPLYLAKAASGATSSVPEADGMGERERETKVFVEGARKLKALALEVLEIDEG